MTVLLFSNQDLDHITAVRRLKVLNNIRLNTDNRKNLVLALLDLSAVFDKVDHIILLARLENWVGLSGTTLNWFKSYLNEKYYFVSIGNNTSEWMEMTSGADNG